MAKIKLVRLGPNKWQLTEGWQSPFMFIPSGFITDGASVPRILWAFASPSGDLFEAAVIHDYMYKNAIKTKAEADHLFKRVAKHYGANRLRRNLAYVFIKLFGKGLY
ncbi:MAG: hypothetical protein ACJAUY_000678 [Cognaticolwellia sp.]|jgi:hypothetical protein